MILKIYFFKLALKNLLPYSIDLIGYLLKGQIRSIRIKFPETKEKKIVFLKNQYFLQCRSNTQMEKLTNLQKHFVLW
jgi:hypothetical protein